MMTRIYFSKLLIDRVKYYQDFFITILISLLWLIPGCSIKNYATRAMADTLAESSDVYASDDDIDFVGEAIPFGLKTIESILAKTPKHRGLLLAAARGFTQYAYVYVESPANEIEDIDIKIAYAERNRAHRLYIRARNYGLRGLETRYENFSDKLRKNQDDIISKTTVEDVPLLYWTAVSWAAAISLSKDDPELIADLPLIESLIYRALELDESFDYGVIHNFLISYEMSKLGVKEELALRARHHFDRAIAISKGYQAAPYVTLAETVSISQQNRKEYQVMLEHALNIDANAHPEWKLVNLVMQRRARFLLARTDDYFVEK